MPVPPDIAPALAAMDALNSYTRGQGNRVVSSQVVYLLKDQAIRVLSALGCATHRRVILNPTCHNCGGDGWHRRPGMREWGHDHVGERCRTCSGSGKVALHFVETTIGEVRWHSPVNHGYGTGLASDLWNAIPMDTAATDPNGWKPRQPGVPMEAGAVARALLTVEAWLLRTWPLPPHEIMEYTLDLGDAGDVTICPRHGEILGHKDVVTNGARVRWLTRTCEADGCGWAPTHSGAADPDVLAWSLAHPQTACRP